jgi:transcriptional regulator with XRE-family HTH domain
MQQQLADRLDVSEKNVHRIEAGANLTIRSLERIADALGVRVAELFEQAHRLGRRNPGRPPKRKTGDPQTSS